MGLFGGSKSKTSTTSNLADNRQVNDAGGGSIQTLRLHADRSTVNVLDGGALQSAASIAIKAIEEASASSRQATALAAGAQMAAIAPVGGMTGQGGGTMFASSSGDALGTARNVTGSATTEAGGKVLAALAVAALVGFIFFKRKG